jgi:hypothetical protein
MIILPRQAWVCFKHRENSHKTLSWIYAGAIGEVKTLQSTFPGAGNRLL